LGYLWNRALPALKVASFRISRFRLLCTHMEAQVDAVTCYMLMAHEYGTR